MANGDVFDRDKVQKAIKAVMELFSEMELTVTEAIHVLYVLNATFKANYPDIHKLITGK